MKSPKMLAAIIVTTTVLMPVCLMLVLFRPLNYRQNSAGGIIVTTSFYPLYFFTSEIGKDKVSVINITPVGAEPHDFEPNSQDLVKIENSQLLVIDGVLEPWAGKVKKGLVGKTTVVLEVGNGLFSKTIANGNGNNGIDPHIWLSPLIAQKMVNKISQALGSVDSRNAIYYQENAKVLNFRLSNLDADFRKGLAQCADHDIITSHAAFGYLADAYGLKQVSIAGLSPDAEPSLKQLAQITDWARQANVKYIFFESLASPKISQALAREIGAKTLTLNPLEGLSREDLNLGADYFTVMESNLSNLRTALSCQ